MRLFLFLSCKITDLTTPFELLEEMKLCIVYDTFIEYIGREVREVNVIYSCMHNKLYLKPNDFSRILHYKCSLQDSCLKRSTMKILFFFIGCYVAPTL